MKLPAWTCCAFLLLSFGTLHAAALDQGTVDRVNALRTIRAEGDKGQYADFNKKMDEGWKYFKQNKKVAVPALQQILAEEAAAKSPNQLVLLDIAYFLAIEGGAANTGPAREALIKIDPAARIVQDNFEELFKLAHLLAGEKDPRLLDAFDRLFLTSNAAVFVPQHAMKLDATLLCVFLYGKYGADSLPHLVALLDQAQHRLRVLEILGWLGNAENVPAIERTMKANRDHDTFLRATAYMMTVGGKAGRSAMLAVKADELAPESKKYYEGVLGAIKAANYAQMEKGVASLPDYKPMDDATLKVRLVKMREAYGKDDTLHPLVILKSKLPRAVLMGELTAARDRSFYRLSNEALSDVKMDNALINALEYRDY